MKPESVTKHKMSEYVAFNRYVMDLLSSSSMVKDGVEAVVIKALAFEAI